MSDEKALITVHPEGEQEKGEMQPPETELSLDTFAGKIQFKWAPAADVSSLGQMPFFIEFLKNGICPRLLTSAAGAHLNWILPAKVSRLSSVSGGCISPFSCSPSG